ncbi:MAG: ferritin family protein [Gammaproteobacteria bacterium]|nr:ferritin family protein [Gammaproteobacteria bacterium]
MLSTNVKTTSDLMSIALQAEREAIRRYTMLAESMHKGMNESAAALFERMVAEETEHERLLLEWMAKENISENPDIGPIKWKDPHVSTVYNDEAYDPYYSTPYKALAFAVHNEEIAFKFYTHVTANSENEAVRKYAEILAREELGHAALLRAERRLAYHKELKSHNTPPKIDPEIIQNQSDLLAAAIHIDEYLESQMAIVAEKNPEIETLRKDTQQQISINKKTLSHQEPPGDEITQSLDQLKTYNSETNERLDNPDLQVQRLWSCCDRSFAFYDAVVESTTDEAVMLTAQNLTTTALDRIGVLKQVFAETTDQP